MSDRIDSRIRALVVELMSDPVEAPPFPLVPEAVPATRRAIRMPGWAVAIATFTIVIGLGVAALVLSDRSDGPPTGERTPTEVVQSLVDAINSGDIDAALGAFAADAQCVAPGLPTCEDLIGFFIAAEARVVFSTCGVEIEPYLQCDGYAHMVIHDALGISEESLAQVPNFPPAFIVEGGRIIQMNFATPFTGDGSLDDRLWAFLLAENAGYVDENGVPEFSAEIVPGFLEDAQRFAEVIDS